jgi:predicted ribosome quality control (RQC) complex YloA/Tae2 family protein
MKYGTRIRYEELEQFVFQFKKEIEGTFLKNVYHYEGRWLFKFTNIEFVYDYSSLWIGSFQEREDKNLHSICIKLRKELGQKKCFHVDLLENDRVVCFDFGTYCIVLEFYAKGNLLLLEKETNKIIVLTRCYEDFRNNCIYPIKPFVIFPQDYSLKKCDWNKDGKSVEFCESGHFETILVGSSEIWKQNYNVHLTKKSKKEKKTPLQNIQNQVTKLSKRFQKKEEEINDYYEKNGGKMDYKEIERMEKEKKLLKKKLQGAMDYLEKVTTEKVVKKKVVSQRKIELNTEKWYHSYYWWRTKNNFLVVGGKSATDNETLVKNYLKDVDYYFHTEDMGSGSFILITEGKTPDIIDLVETAEGVFSLSKYWNETKTGKVFHVLGSQVSKTPPTGMSLSKGSFMIYGKKEFISVHQTILGYVLTEENELMLAPYRIVERYKGKKIKLLPKPNVKKMKGKHLMEKLQNGLGIVPKSISSVFSKPCSISVV